MEPQLISEETLKEKCYRLRETTNYKLNSEEPVLVMIDGRSFSKLIKKKFNLPFDNLFIDIMNKVAMHVCENIQSVKLAYCQSDEISFFIDSRPSGDKTPTLFCDGRLNKILPLIASMASSKFNQLIIKNTIGKLYGETEGYIGQAEINGCLDKIKLAEFDCKAWNVPNDNDVYAWFLFRQLDCIRNSKQQAAQTYISHNKLCGKNTDEQISMLLNEKGINWHEYEDDKKFGRLIYKELMTLSNEYGEFERSKWTTHNGFELSSPENHQKFLELIKTL